MFRVAHKQLRPDCAACFFALLTLVLLSGGCLGQSATLSLSSASTMAGSTVTIPLSLNATGVQPAALQWTLDYSSSDIASISVSAGPVAVDASKSIQCLPTAASTICLLTGVNTNTIANGIVATV